jgi:SAM-dependent methyltransferase
VADDREHLRTTFAQVAELYDRARPGYPPQVFDDLVALAQLDARARVLEVGCGTGQATRDLVGRGLDVTCIELGDDLAAVARRNVPEAEVVTANFETWEPERADFDVVVAFTAFHWIDPELRYAKSARLGRALAVVGTHHVSPEGSDTFFADVQEDYNAVTRPEDPGDPPGRPEAVEGLRAEIEASGFFEHVAERRYLWEQEYDAQSYIDVLDTYSGHRALDDARRNELYERIRRRIEARPGGVVRKTYLTTLDVARVTTGA